MVDRSDHARRSDVAVALDLQEHARAGPGADAAGARVEPKNGRTPAECGRLQPAGQPHNRPLPARALAGTTRRAIAYSKRSRGRLRGHCNRSKECNTLAVYSFKLQRICRICVQRMKIVAKVQLAIPNLKTTGKAHRASLSALSSASIRSDSQIIRVPLPTLRRHPRGCRRTARGRCGSPAAASTSGIRRPGIGRGGCAG